MAILIDLRPLQDIKCSGVSIYIEGFLHNFIEVEKHHQQCDVILFFNSSRDFLLPPFINKYREIEGVSFVRRRIPNILLNLACSLFRHPKIDTLVDARIDEVWVLDPRPCPVSSEVKKHIIIHDISLFRYPEFFSLKSKVFSYMIRLKKELSEAFIIHPVSKFTQLELKRFFGVSEDKMQVLNPCLDSLLPDQLAVSKIDLHKKYGIKSTARVLFALSTIEPRKNLALVIDQFKKGYFKGYDVLLIGGARDSKVFSDVMLEFDDRIVFTGRLTDKEKWQLYKSVHGFVNFSKYEGFGLQLKEAMNFSLPLFLSDIEVYREVVSDYPHVTWFSLRNL